MERLFFCLSNFLLLLPFADVMVLNDIIEQAAGRQSRTPEQGGNVECINSFAHVTFFLTVFYHPLSQMCISCVMSILSF